MKLVIPNFYEKALSLFGHRLQIKHKVKGLAHREMQSTKLFLILMDECKELEEEIAKLDKIKSLGKVEHVIDEALDVMICGMIIVDRALQELKGAEH